MKQLNGSQEIEEHKKVTINKWKLHELKQFDAFGPQR